MKICDICKSDEDIKNVSLYVDEKKECSDAYTQQDLCIACRKLLAKLHSDFLQSA